MHIGRKKIMCNKLEEIIKVEIANSKQGAIAIDRYMELCLLHEEYGYYMSNNPFGRGGDFITAPEISQIFGDIIGGFLVQNWVRMGRPTPFALVELGAGNGTLMADILRIGKKSLPDFFNSAQIHLVEVSPILKKKQQDILKDTSPTWHKTIDTVPTDMPIILVANEFFDALPIKQYVYRNKNLYERLVSWNKDKGKFFIKESDICNQNIELPQNIKEEDIYEISPVALSIMHGLCRRLKKQHGFAVIIDYGYISHGFGDSLQAVYKHKKTDIFANIGKQDLTAHVDFQALKKVAIQEEVGITGPITQVEFLKFLEIEQYTEQLAKRATDRQKADLISAYHRLTSAFEMGYLFKVLGVSY